MLNEGDLRKIAKRAIKTDNMLKQYSIQIKDEKALIFYSSGDARKMLNILEITFQRFRSRDKLNRYHIIA